MKRILILVFALALFGCNDIPKSSYEATSGYSKSINDTDEQKHPGKLLMESKCNACHDPSASMENRLAPPMIAIKRHYITEGTTKKEFISDMLDWIKEPSEEKSKMPGAVRRFGVMSYQKFSEEDIIKISEYIFENDIEQPEWFESHFRQGQGRRKG